MSTRRPGLDVIEGRGRLVSECEPQPPSRRRSLVVGRLSAEVAGGVAFPAAFLYAGAHLSFVRMAAAAAAPWVPALLVGIAVVVAFAGPHLAGRAPRPPATGPIVNGAALTCFLIPLAQAWTTARTAPSVIAGVLPWNDATGYLAGATRLLAGLRIDKWGTRRPLNATLFAARLGIVDHDLRAALVLQALLAGLACLVVARMVSRRLGVGAGIAMFAGLYAFSSGYIALTLTEALGVTLGAFAFAALWRGTFRREWAVLALGFFLLGLALSARAGAFAVVPAVALWAGRLWRRRGSALNWTPVGVAAGAVAVAFTVNYAVAAMYGAGTSNVNGNFSYTLYGLSVGGAGWTQVLRDYPELQHMGEGAQAKFIYARAAHQVASHPHRFALGYLRGLRSIGSENDLLHAARAFAVTPLGRAAGVVLILGAFLVVALRRSAVIGPALWTAVVVGLVPLLFAGEAVPYGRVRYLFLAALFVVIVGTALRGVIDPTRGLFMAGAVGLVVSAPFILPDGGVRTLAPTAPLVALGLALVVHTLSRVAPRATGAPIAVHDAPGGHGLVAAGVGFAVVAAVLFVLVPVVRAPRVVAHAEDCPAGSTRAAVRMLAGVVVEPGINDHRGWTSTISVRRLRSHLGVNELAPVLRAIREPTAVALASGDAPTITGPPDLPITLGRQLTLCGQSEDTSAGRVFRVDHWAPMHRTPARS